MIVELDEMKAYLGIDGTDNDAVISALCDSAEAKLTAETGRDWNTYATHDLYNLAAEVIKLNVWMAFFSLRADASNYNTFIEQSARAMVLQLGLAVTKERTEEEEA